MDNSEFVILLYYKYVTLLDPEKVRDEQKALCQKLGLKGRIIVAHEGINGTVEGTVEATEKYMSAMEDSKYFVGISYKKSKGTGNAFPKLSVKVRPEVVTSKVVGLEPQKVTGKYLSADELQQWFQSKKEFYIVDMRNDYEYASGYFAGFIPSGMKHFFDLSDVLPRLSHLRGKTIVTVCTGGIRCEKASGFLLMNGFDDVYQLKDGIQTYMEKYPDQYFKGKLYVFDNRLTVGFNSNASTQEVVGKCYHCQVPSEQYVNCEYDICHFHTICCNDCLDIETGFFFCNAECKEEYLLQQSKRLAKSSQAGVTAG